MKTYKGIHDEQINILVIYDIADSKRRYHVAKVMESFGVRVQESAFECHIYSYKWNSFVTKIQKLTDDSDSIRAYFIKDAYIDLKDNTEKHISNERIVIV